LVAHALWPAQTELTDDEIARSRGRCRGRVDLRPPSLPVARQSDAEVSNRAGVLLHSPEVRVVQGVGLRPAVVAPTVLARGRAARARADVVVGLTGAEDHWVARRV